MKITEIFASQNFEGGPTFGRTTVFVRCYQCNMKPKCVWCDVITYKPREMNISEIISEIRKYENVSHVTFTGGDFTCHMEEMEEIMNILKGMDSYSFSIETNGLKFIIPPKFEYVACSPKKQKMNDAILRTYNTCKNVFFKFVVEDRKSYEFWRDTIKALGLDRNKVYMMPEGINAETVKQKTIELSKWCIEDGFNMSTRAQILLFGKKKGV
jgi:7-carboxy-7-deazaguanine synthase